MGLLVAAGLYEHLKGQPENTKHQTFNAIYSPHDHNGSKGINEILAIAGIEYPNQMKAFANAAVKGTADQILNKQNTISGLAIAAPATL